MKRGHPVSARLTAEELATLRSIGAESDADAVRALIAEHKTGQIVARLVRAEIEPLRAQLDRIEATQAEVIAQEVSDVINEFIGGSTTYEEEGG